MFRGITIRLYHPPDRARLLRTLQRLKNAGADAVSIVPHNYCLIRMDPGNPKHDVLPVPPNLTGRAGPSIFADLDEGGKMGIGLVGNTTPIEDVGIACELAQEQGFQVLLKPHVDPLYGHSDGHYYPAGWRGSMELADVDAFRRSYCEDFLAPYVDLAKQQSLPLLSLGVEYVQITRDQGAAFWCAVADWVVARGYTGGLTYSANWGWGADAEFQRLADLWRHPQVAYIGVDAYYPLWPVQLTEQSVQPGWNPAPGTPDADPSVDQLVQGWTQPHLTPNGTPLDVSPAEAMLTVSRATGKPLIFTEVGYSNRQGAAWEPGRDSRPDDQIDDPTRSGALQQRLFEAFRRVWAGVPEFAGFFWWDASLNPAEDPRTVVTHNILATRLEPRLFREFAPPTREPQPPGVPRELPVPPGVIPSIPPTGPIPKHGVHGPNSRFRDSQHPWERITATRAAWVKLLYDSRFETHTRADAEEARRRGLRVIVRTSADADNLMPIPEEVDRAVAEFQGLAEVIEVGNEPPTGASVGGQPLSRWDHAVRLEEIARNQKGRVNAAGMRLCPGGWMAHEIAPDANGDALAQRLHQVYRLYDAIAVHNYDPGDLLAPDPRGHLESWHRAFPDKPIYVTEYGLAYRWLLRDAGVPPDEAHFPEHSREKARRYAKYLQSLQSLDYVAAAFIFILGGTADWDHLGGSPDNGYWLTDEAWGTLPVSLTQLVQQVSLRLRAAPSIPPEKFAQVLQNNGSLALGEAPAETFYTLCIQNGVDPAIALAFFALETRYGTAGDAPTLKNWGMLWDKRANRIGSYPTWQAGLADWLQRVQGPAYLAAGEPTLATIVPIYKPFGLKQYNNDPAQYVTAAQALIATWMGM